MTGDDRLEKYRGKRDFGKTGEPKGTRRKRSGQRSGGPRFVVQKHDASSLHYDFRLEAGGVLKSWAVPKGPPSDPKDKVLAAPTEDHPLDYADFEGVIPDGEYGAGPVEVWDTGTYRNLTEDHGEEVPVEEAIERGHLKVALEGEKLRGGYALTRMRRGGKSPGWLLVKVRDDEVGHGRDPRRARPESVQTGRTLDDIKDDSARETASRRAR
jgi:DNA ligase D-like protein (predicted 3'-phosphoesterase)